MSKTETEMVKRNKMKLENQGHWHQKELWTFPDEQMLKRKAILSGVVEEL